MTHSTNDAVLKEVQMIHGRQLTGPTRTIRSKAAPDPRSTDETANFAAVLLDLDARAAWGAADSMLRDEHSPPVFLLSSRSDPDWSSAVQAGSVLDKRTDAASLLRQVSTWLSVPARLAREIKSAQRLVIRWLKPCNWSATAIPLRRHWGINE